MFYSKEFCIGILSGFNYLFIFFCLFGQGLCITTPPEWHEHARLLGNYSDLWVDTNGDGSYDILTIEAGINVISPGEYSLTGYLYDSKNRQIAWSIDHKNLSPGNCRMALHFDSTDIIINNTNKQLFLRDILLTFGNSPSGSIISTDWVYQASNISAYNLSRVDEIPIQEKTISGLANGEILLTAYIDKSIPVISNSYILDLFSIHMPPFSSDFTVSFPRITKDLSGYAYDTGGVYMPAMPNNFSIIAKNVKNLDIGLKKQQGSYENSSNVWKEQYARVWISSQSIANDDGIAAIESNLISPGIYQVKIFGEAAPNATSVNITMSLVKKVLVNGKFNISINTTGFPQGDYSFTAEAINGSFCLDEINFESDS